jgi:membrane peptidoglycan carboxypeptidase
MKAPVLVERITNPTSRVVYEGIPKPERRVISERASAELYKAMQATVSSGTARKVFRGANKSPVLNSLVIGGKTGSIHDNPRYDWFVGFAADPRTGDAIVVSSMVAHEDFIGERAGRYAMIAMESYFSRNSTPVAVPAGKAKRRR